jgi:hypothetical protein
MPVYWAKLAESMVEEIEGFETAPATYFQVAADRTSTSNLLLTVLNKAGIPTDKLGDSTGILDV